MSNLTSSKPHPTSSDGGAHSVQIIGLPAEKALGERLKLVVNDLGSDKSVTATGKSIRQLKRYMSGDEPPFGVLKRLSEESGATLDWITYGNAQSSKDHELAIPYAEREIRRAREMLREVTNHEGRDRLHEYIVVMGQSIEVHRRLVELEKGGTVRSSTSAYARGLEPALEFSGFIPIPRLDVRASAGNGRVAIPEDSENEIVAFKEEWLRRLGVRPKSAMVIVAEGDSMADTIGHGDLVLLDRSIDRVVDDGIYVLVYDGMVKLKRVQVLRSGIVLLKSDNPAYLTEEVQPHELPELTIEGRVRWAGGAI